MESIAFQVNSQIAKDLSNVMNEIIEARESSRHIDERIEFVNKEIKVQKQNIIDIIEKNTNLKVDKLSMKGGLGGSVYGTPMTHLEKEEQDWINYVLTSQQAGDDKLVGIFDESDITDMQAISDTYDKKLGKLGDTQFRGGDISCQLFMDTDVLFLSRETISDKLESFTAEEISAMLLREIGIILGIVEHIVDNTYKVKVVNHVATNFINNSTNQKKKLAFTRNNMKIAKSNKQTPAPLKLVDRCIERINNIVQEEPENFMSKLYKYLVAPALLIILAILTPAVMGATVLVTIGNDSINTLYAKVVRNAKFSDKTSDTLWTNKKLSVMYSRGLSYVTRIGMGSSLASAELKYNKAMNIADFKAVVGVADKTAFSYNMSKIYTVSSVLISGSAPGLLNTNTVAKLKRLLRNNVALFKQGNTSSELVAAYLKDYDRIVKLMDDMSSSVKAEDKIGKAVKVLEKVLLAPMGLVTHNINETMRVLSNAADELNNNKLYVNASKLDQLAKDL